MTYKLNPFTGKLDTSDGPQGPAGVVSAAGPGSQGTPSISFAADLDTGLYNYTANGIAVSTGGTGRLFVDASGNVGIGTTSPIFGVGDGLEVFRSGVSTIRVSSNSQGVELRSNAGTGTLETRGAFPLLFGVQGTERLRITSTGTLMHIGAGNSTTPAVQFNGSAPVDSLVIDSTGKLGLGTSAPGYPLTVLANGGANTNNIIAHLYNYNVYSARGLFIYNGRHVASGRDNAQVTFDVQSGASNGTMLFQTDGNTALTIDGSQRVGIGTTSPQKELHIEGGADTQIRINSSAGGLAGIQFGDTADTVRCGIQGDSSDNSLQFRGYNNAERARIDSSGTFRVKGAGTAGVTDAVQLNGSAPSNSLVIDSSGRLLVGTASSVGFIGSTAATIQAINTSTQYALGMERATADLSGPVCVFRKTRSTTNGGVTIVNSGDSLGDLRWAGTDGSAAVTAAQIKAEVDGTPGTNDMPGRLVFSTTADGASSPTARMTIKNDGKVGMGTTSPEAELHVGPSGTNTRLRLTNDNTGHTASDGFQLSTNAAKDAFVYNWEDANLVFGTNNTPRATIDNSGRLLVGTSTAFDTNAVFEAVSTSNVIGQFCRTNGVEAAVTVQSTPGTLASPTPHNANASIGALYFRGYDTASWRLGAKISTETDGQTWAAGDCPGRLVFSTTAAGASSPTERMRIANDGRTSMFGSGNVAVNILTAAAAGNTDRWLLTGRYGATSTTTGTASFQVFSNGDVANTNDVYGAISDIKLKENIVDAESQWDDFKAVRFRKYNFKEETGHETFTQLGVIAQELELVSPGLVTETPDLDEEGNDLGTTTKSVKYSVLTKKALVALQEAMERIETLEAKVAALEAQ